MKPIQKDLIKDILTLSFTTINQTKRQMKKELKDKAKSTTEILDENLGGLWVRLSDAQKIIKEKDDMSLVSNLCALIRHYIEPKEDTISDILISEVAKIEKYLTKLKDK